MFTNFATIFTLAVAAVSVTAQGTHTAKCNTGSLQCCNEIKQVGNYDAGAIASLLKVDAKQITGQLGVGCNPVTVIGKGSSSAWYVYSRHMILIFADPHFQHCHSRLLRQCPPEDSHRRKLHSCSCQCLNVVLPLQSYISPCITALLGPLDF